MELCCGDLKAVVVAHALEITTVQWCPSGPYLYIAPAPKVLS